MLLQTMPAPDELHTANPDIAWTSFVDWAQRTFESGSRA
jgi:hypothetical protein